MLRNYFKIALRNLKHRKAYTLINVLGLGLGIACAILIFTVIKYHLSFDAFHSKADRIYRITTELHEDEVSNIPGVPSPVGEAFRNDYTFAEKVATVFSSEDEVVSIPSSADQKKFKEDIAFAEPAFFDILDFPLVRGNMQSVLSKPNTAFITEKIAKKYFGQQDPIGQTIRIDNKLDVIVIGILKDLPANTDRLQEIYLPFANMKDLKPWLVEDFWLNVNSNMHCFVLLKPGVSSAAVDKALATMSGKYYDKEHAEEWRFQLQHISDIHFNPELGGYVAKKYLWALSLIGFFLIITACVNFINLATAQALGRSKEIGVRKVLGSHRRQLFWQFIAETGLITMLALAVGFVLACLALPFVNQLFDTQVQINIFRDIYLFAFLPVLLLLVIFCSGSYPGLILAGFQPVLALKGKLSQRHVGGFSLRRSLVITQFAISQLLIIGLIVIANQMRYARQADLGYQREAIIMLPVPDKETLKISTFRSQLSQIAGVEKATFCYAPPTSESANETGIHFDSRPEDEKFLLSYRVGDDQYVPTFGLEVIAGRNLFPSDTVREYLLNETAVKKLGVSPNEVIGKNANINGKDGTVVGIIRDFHNKSFHEVIDPLCITSSTIWYFNCAVKVNPAVLQPTLENIEKVWKGNFPDGVYKYDFLDEQLARFYKQDYIFLRLIQAFSGIAIIIGCLGLYGLISFMAAQKTKEVGVRKVLGASVQNIVWLFGKEFTRLLFIAFVITAPFARWAMNSWLENFVYRINIGVGVFVLAILITLTVAALTVGYRSIKAALMNPVKSLRSE